jgi:serine/threonine protein kinase
MSVVPGVARLRCAEMTLLKTGRYQLLEELGRGAMGVVYKAFDPLIGRTVAVKAMRLSAAGTGMRHAELLNRFQTETRAAGLLTHPNIVVVYDAGEDEGVFYITMEYVEGRSLQDRIDQKQVFPLPRILGIMEQACSAIGYAHQHSVVHRDIKPANIMLTGDDVVKVTDFGTAKILQLGTTQSGQIIGTPSYMSPEQVKGKLVDGRSDIFSLGVILYELVTGEKPFPGQNVTTVIYKIVNTDPIPPRELDTSVPPGLNYIITKALTKDANSRFSTCEEFLEALRNYQDLGAGGEPTVVIPKFVPPPVISHPARAREDVVSSSRVGREPHSVAADKLPPPLPPLPEALPAGEAQPKSKYRLAWLSLVILLTLIGAGVYFKWPELRGVLQQARTSMAKGPQTEANPPPAPTNPPPASPSANETPPASPAANAGLVSQPVKQAPAAIPASAVQEARNPKKDIATRTPRAVDQEGDEDRPRTAHGKGEVDVLTEISGATAILEGPDSSTYNQHAPCRFEDLPPGRYTLAVTLEGYRTERRIIELRAGQIEPIRINFEGLVGGISITGDTPGADVYVNGARRPEVTPALIHLPPGSYTIRVEKSGFESKESRVAVQANQMVQLNGKLEEEQQQHRLVGWVEVSSSPPGAAILLNNQNTGRRTPDRLELPPGQYTLTLDLNGYQATTGTVVVEENRIVDFAKTLSPP